LEYGINNEGLPNPAKRQDQIKIGDRIASKSMYENGGITNYNKINWLVKNNADKIIYRMEIVIR